MYIYNYIYIYTCTCIQICITCSCTAACRVCKALCYWVYMCVVCRLQGAILLMFSPSKLEMSKTFTFSTNIFQLIYTIYIYIYMYKNLFHPHIPRLVSTWFNGTCTGKSRTVDIPIKTNPPTFLQLCNPTASSRVPECRSGLLGIRQTIFSIIPYLPRSGLLLHSPIQGPGDLKWLRELCMILAGNLAEIRLWVGVSGLTVPPQEVFGSTGYRQGLWWSKEV